MVVFCRPSVNRMWPDWIQAWSSKAAVHSGCCEWIFAATAFISWRWYEICPGKSVSLYFCCSLLVDLSVRCVTLAVCEHWLIPLGSSWLLALTHSSWFYDVCEHWPYLYCIADETRSQLMHSYMTHIVVTGVDIVLLQKERRSLETKRLDLDACKSHLRRAKSQPAKDAVSL